MELSSDKRALAIELTSGTLALRWSSSPPFCGHVGSFVTRTRPRAAYEEFAAEKRAVRLRET